MINDGASVWQKLMIGVCYAVMIAVNVAANALPINGMSTGEISAAFPNLFAPIGWTFAIWGFIYLLLGLHTAYQFGWLDNKSASANNLLLVRTGLLFALTSLVNAAWIFAWHYLLIPLSMVLMLMLLLLLGAIVLLHKRAQLSPREQLLVRLPFSVYFGWITVATIANATVLLVNIGWEGFGIAESTWTALMLVVGMIIGIATIVNLRDSAYGLVLVWAYAGILAKHFAPAGFAGEYPLVMGVAGVSIVILAAVTSVVARQVSAKPI